MDSQRQRLLVSRAASGDADALSELLAHFGPQVEAALRVGRRWQANLDTADVMQVTYLEAFMQIRRFDPSRSGAFLQWLRQIAANNLRDAIRGLTGATRPPSERRVEIADSQDSVLRLADLMGVTTTTPSRAARRSEAHRILSAAVARLPDDYGEVVRRHDLEGIPVTQVAAALGRSAGAVHMLRARALGRLQEMLGGRSDILDSRA